MLGTAGGLDRVGGIDFDETLLSYTREGADELATLEKKDKET